MTPLGQWHTALPAELRALLAVGSVGRLHLLGCAAAGLPRSKGKPGLAAHCANMALEALGESPISGELAAQVLAGTVLAPLLPGATLDALRAVVRAWKRPGNLGYLERLAAKRDMERIRRYVEDRVRAEPGNLFWREQAMNVGMYEAEHGWLRSMLGVDGWPDLGPGGLAVHAALEGQVAAAEGAHGAAERLAGKAGALYGPGWTLARRAQARLAAEDREGGLALLLACLREDPWRIQAALRAHDLLERIDEATAPLPGSGGVAVLLYSWNKAEDLDATLASLAASHLGGAVIHALDNGSTDATPEVLRAWEERLGRERLRVTTLPVNVGAAAARNWLMHLPEVRATDWCVYLDDDVVLEPDWLVRLGAAVKLHPGAGVWGCRVVDAAQPGLLQSVDFHLLPGQPEQRLDLTNLTPHAVALSNLHVQVLDRGDFTYLRPCASVTGCCHLFRTAELLETGDFSLYLSPSQYDDMERDLRMCAGGRFAVYQGHLRVLHRKRSGRAALVRVPEEANALGNKYKMSVMHGPEEVAASTVAEQRLLLADLDARLGLVGEAVGELAP
ncbi:MAG: glycosyltransferase family 2 protein [Desulfovibrionaceae bacterium]